MICVRPLSFVCAALYLQAFTARAAPAPSASSSLPAEIVPSGHAAHPHPNQSIQGQINGALTVPSATTTPPPPKPTTTSAPPLPPPPSTTTAPLPTPSANCYKKNDAGIALSYTLTGNALMNEANIGYQGSVLHSNILKCGVNTLGDFTFNPGVSYAEVLEDHAALGLWTAQFTLAIDTGDCVHKVLVDVGPKNANVTGNCHGLDG